MRIVVQRILEGKVEVDGKITGKAKNGLLLFVGFSEDDNDSDLEYLKQKILNLRIFEDSTGKMNHSIIDIKGEILSVPQFTLYGDVRKGRRPSFTDAAEPLKANKLFDAFTMQLRESGLTIETGIFAADMKVSLINNGPVTILLDSKKKF